MDASSSSAAASRSSRLSNKVPRAVNMSKDNNQEEDFFLFKNMKTIDCYNFEEDEWVTVLELDPDSSRLLGRLTKSQLQFKSEPIDLANADKSQIDASTQRLTWYTTGIKGFATSEDEDVRTYSHAKSFRYLSILFKKCGRTAIDTRSVHDQEPLTQIYQLFRASNRKKGPMWIRIAFHVKLLLTEVDKIKSLGLSQIMEWDVPQTTGTKMNTAVKDILRSGKQKKETKSIPEGSTKIPVNPAVYRDDSVAVTFEYWSKADQTWVLMENCQTVELRLTMRFGELMLCVSAYREPLIMRDFPHGNSQGLKNIKEARDRAAFIATWFLHWSSDDIEGYIQNNSSSQMSYHMLLKKSGQLSAMGDDSTVLGTNRWRFDNNTLKLESIHDLIKDEFSSSIEKVPTVWIRLQATKSVTKLLPFFNEVSRLKNISGREEAMLAFLRKSNRTTNRPAIDEEAAINTAAQTQEWLMNDKGGHVLGYKDSSFTISDKETKDNNEGKIDPTSNSRFLKTTTDTVKGHISEESDIDPLAIFKDEPIVESGSSKPFVSDFYHDLISIDSPRKPVELQVLEDYQLASAIQQSDLQNLYEKQDEMVWDSNAHDLLCFQEGESSKSQTIERNFNEEWRLSLKEPNTDQNTTKIKKGADIHTGDSEPGDVGAVVEADVMESEALMFGENRLKAWNILGPSEEPWKRPFRGINVYPVNVPRKTLSRHSSKEFSLKAWEDNTDRPPHDQLKRPNTSVARDNKSENSYTIGRPDTSVSTKSDNSLTSIPAEQDEIETKPKDNNEQPSKLTSSSRRLATAPNVNTGRLIDTSSVSPKEDKLKKSTQSLVAGSLTFNSNGSEEILLLYDACEVSATSKPDAVIPESNISLMSRELQNCFAAHPSNTGDLSSASDSGDLIEQKHYDLDSDENDLLKTDDMSFGGLIPLRPFSKIGLKQGEESIKNTIDEDVNSVSSTNNTPKPPQFLIDNDNQEDSDSFSSRAVKITKSSCHGRAVTLEERKMTSSVSAEEEDDTVSVESVARSSKQTSRFASAQPEAEHTPPTHPCIPSDHPLGNDPQANLYGQDMGYHPYFAPGMQMIVNYSSDNVPSTNTQQMIYNLEIERQRHMQEAARCEQEIARCYEIQRRRHLEAATAYHADIMRLHGGISAQQQLMWTNVNSYQQPMPYSKFS